MITLFTDLFNKHFVSGPGLHFDRQILDFKEGIRLPRWLVVQNPPANAGDLRHVG